MLHLCLCFALRESTWSSSPKILFLDLRWTLGAIFGQIVASLNAHITLDYARKHFSWHVQPLCTWYMRPKHYGRLGNIFDHTNILIYYNKHITNLQWISHIFRPMKYPFITSQWLAILKPSWKQYSFLFGPTKFCHYPYVDVYGVYLRPGIRGTQVKSSVRMKKTQESSKWLFLGNLIPEIESEAPN